MYIIGIYTSQRSRFEQIMTVISSQIEQYDNAFQFRYISKTNYSNELAGQILLVDIRAQKDFRYLVSASQQMAFPVFQILLYDQSPVVLTPELMRFSAYLNLNENIVAQLLQIIDRHHQTQQLYVVKNKKSIRCFHPHDIIFLEIDKHCVKLSSLSGSIKFWGTLEEEEKKLTPMGFVRIHKSYIVNLDWIQKSSYFCVELKTKNCLPIGRKYRSDFQSKYEIFLRNHEQI